MNYCYYIFGLRLPFGLRFDLQSHPPNRLIKFLFVGSRTLLHHFLHPNITVFDLWFTTLGGKYP